MSVFNRQLEIYERKVLIRAQAAVLLQLRGYDISDPTVLENPPEIP